MKKVFILSLVLFLYIGCKEACEPIPKEILSYMPDEEDKVIVFSNGHDSVLLYVEKYYANEMPNSCHKGHRDCCEYTAGMKTGIDSTFQIGMSFGISYSIISGSLQYFISLRSSDSGYRQEFIIGKQDIPFHQVKEHPLFGDTVYLDQKGRERYDSITVVRAEGIVRFYDNKYDCYWERVL